MSVNILMSTYNGEKYLVEQIESILEQSQTDISLIVRDDGSSDKTAEILEKYANEGKLKWYPGKNLGYAKSFWHLLCNCEQADYYAFCDQDDVWDKDKIKIAVDMLEKENSNTPLLYCGMVRTTDENLNYKYDFFDREHIIDYPHSLLGNIAPGCTFVFNDSLRKFLVQYDCGKYEMQLHDWTVYKIAACLGKVIYDRQTHMCYRQHVNNALGASNPNKLVRFFRILENFLMNKNPRLASNNANILEKIYGKYMSEENKSYTYIIAHYMDSFKNKREIIKRNIFNKRGLRYIYFIFKVLSNRL